MESMMQWALKYARMKLAVFPLKAKDKQPATANGCKDATTDIGQIEIWWSINPNYNIGIATGRVSGGLVVIDLDIDKDKGINGNDSLREWEHEHGELPETWRSITGRGGYHYIYRDKATNKNRVNLYDGVDIRGDGGYIVAPPSVHPNGNTYEWEQGPGDCDIAQVDSRVVNFLLGPAPEGWESQSFELPDTVPEGQRVTTMVALIGSLKAKGVTNEAIKAAVREENDLKCVPPLTDQELNKEVFPALERQWKATSPYNKAVYDKGKFRQQVHKKDISYTDTNDLLTADLPPTLFLVDGILTQGLGGLSAKSKIGKSWLALQLSVDLALGNKFLGFTTKQCGVLYIDLENTKSLTQERLRAILDGREPPKPGNLFFAHDFNLMGEGMEEDLIDFLENHPNVRFVVIDVFQKVKRGKQLNQTDYEADYEILTKLKAIADRFAACVFLIYHDRKFVDPTDPHSNVLGSTAIMGVSDFLWVLFKEKREDKEATLAIAGRTLIDSSYKLKRDGVKWENMGNAAAVEETRKRREYAQDPVVNTIKCLLDQGKGKWRGRVKEIIESSQYFKGCRIYGTSQKVGNQIKRRLEDMEKYDSIHHFTVDKGTAASIHVFESENPFLKDWS